MSGTSSIIDLDKLIHMVGTIREILLQGVSFLLRYIGWILKTYILLIIFILSLFITVGTDFSKIFLSMFLITPGVGLGQGGDLEVDTQGFILFLIFWGTIFGLLSELVSRFSRITKFLTYKTLLILGFVLHIVFLIVFSQRIDLWFDVVFTSISFITFLVSIFFLKKINQLAEVIKKLR